MLSPNVRYLAHAILDPDAALAGLEVEIQWVRTMRARATASFGQPYNYSGQTYAPAEMTPTVAAIAEVAAARAGHPFNNCLCNLYETGSNTMGFHRDSYDALEPGSWIAIASLGATRSLMFRNHERGRRVCFALEHGSLLLMDEMTQVAWEHAVPKAPGAGRRISLTFRKFTAP